MKPQADDGKWSKAKQTLKQMGVATDEQICGELGTDWEDTYEQLAREKEARQRLGLPKSILSGSTIKDEDELDQQAAAPAGGDRKEADEERGAMAEPAARMLAPGEVLVDDLGREWRAADGFRSL